MALVGASMMFASRLSRLILCLAFAGATPAFAACGPVGPTTVCAPGLYLYEGGCTTGAGQSYATCIKGHTENLTTEEKARIEAAVDAGLKGGGSTVIDLSKTVVKEQLPDVAKQVVRDCLELSKDFATPAERAGIEEQLDALESTLKTLSAGEIRLDPPSGSYEQAIEVIGTGWPPNTDMEVSFQQTVIEATTNDNGKFRMTVHLDPTFEGVSKSTVTIRAAPADASMMFEDKARYQVQP